VLLLPTIADVRTAKGRIAQYAHITPVLTSKTLDTASGANLSSNARISRRWVRSSSGAPAMRCFLSPKTKPGGASRPIHRAITRRH